MLAGGAKRLVNRHLSVLVRGIYGVVPADGRADNGIDLFRRIPAVVIGRVRGREGQNAVRIRDLGDLHIEHPVVEQNGVAVRKRIVVDADAGAFAVDAVIPAVPAAEHAGRYAVHLGYVRIQPDDFHALDGGKRVAGGGAFGDGNLGVVNVLAQSHDADGNRPVVGSRDGRRQHRQRQQQGGEANNHFFHLLIFPFVNRSITAFRTVSAANSDFPRSRRGKRRNDTNIE